VLDEDWWFGGDTNQGVNGLTCAKACPSTPLRDRLWNTDKDGGDTDHGVNGLTCAKAYPSTPLRDRLWNTEKDGEDTNKGELGGWWRHQPWRISPGKRR